MTCNEVRFHSHLPARKVVLGAPQNPRQWASPLLTRQRRMGTHLIYVEMLSEIAVERSSTRFVNAYLHESRTQCPSEVLVTWPSDLSDSIAWNNLTRCNGPTN